MLVFSASAMRTISATSLLAILLCCMYFCSHIFVVSGLCLEDQRSLLLQLQNNLTASADPFHADCCEWDDPLDYGCCEGDDPLNSDCCWGRNVDWSYKPDWWDQSLPCSQWSGVTCDEEGHVIGLDLSEKSITGGINDSSSLFSLQHLRILNLAHNYFDSGIPSGFNKLENLTYLNFSNARFVGQVPTEISQLTSLVTLDISSFHGELTLENPNLGMLVQNLTKIRQLYLDGVNICAQGQDWSTALLQIPTLQELSMLDCNISGPLDSTLSGLKNLSLLRLAWNNLSSPVPETFGEFKNLTTLILHDCGLTGMFPQKIFQVRTLSFIDISYNDDLHGFLPDFPLNGSLQSLSITYTKFSGPLPNSISNLRQLSTLNLSNSQLNGTLPHSLSNLTQLVELDLSFNGFVGPIPSLAMCQKIQHVDLSYNHLTGTIPSSHFEALANLVELNLESNLFAGKIPSSIFTLPWLQGELVLSNNEFDGELEDFINASCGIKLLDLSHNHLKGPIPISVFQFTNLEVLDLSSNKLSGTMELNMIGKKGSLISLDLSNNNLSIIDGTTASSCFPRFRLLKRLRLTSCKLTTFPQFLKNQSLPSELDLSNNYITGTIPNLTSNSFDLVYLNLSYNYLTDWEEPLLNKTFNLTIIDLHSNHLQGPLPILPESVKYLDYSRNNLSSVIPPTIDNYLCNIEFLSFSSNNLQGNIPESLCNAPKLQLLDLSDNALTGTIPKCLIAMNGTLTMLNLGKNKLSGTIDTFPSSCNLRTLHLNGNSLQGKLSRYLVNCTQLEVLDIGDNQINGQFPCWLKSISTLRVLILRSNKLHGSLKCPGTQGAWPYLQIVDLVSNNFGGKIPMSFFETWKAMMAYENNGSSSELDHLKFETEPEVYYHDRVTVTIKKKTVELVKILTIFTAVDLSCNKFKGLIPEGLGQLNALYILNLSHNAFSGYIPSSFGNLKDLESLDLSNNHLRGEIPTQLASLSFLSFMNLSYNHLVGRIPTGTQIQSFDAASFKGNDGLCGPPLTQNCSDDGGKGTSPPASKNSQTDTKSSIDWNFISAELGFTFGIGIVALPLVLYKPWRIWYWERVDNMLYRIFPQLDFVYECHGGQRYRTLRWKSY